MVIRAASALLFAFFPMSLVKNTTFFPTIFSYSSSTRAPVHCIQFAFFFQVRYFRTITKRTPLQSVVKKIRVHSVQSQ